MGRVGKSERARSNQRKRESILISQELEGCLSSLRIAPPCIPRMERPWTNHTYRSKMSEKALKRLCIELSGKNHMKSSMCLHIATIRTIHRFDRADFSSRARLRNRSWKFKNSSEKFNMKKKCAVLLKKSYTRKTPQFADRKLVEYI